MLSKLALPSSIPTNVKALPGVGALRGYTDDRHFFWFLLAPGEPGRYGPLANYLPWGGKGGFGFGVGLVLDILSKASIKPSTHPEGDAELALLRLVTNWS